MGKGIKSFCNGQDSTSTLDQRRPSIDVDYETAATPLPTLEEMIMRLERSTLLEEEKEEEEEGRYGGNGIPRRRSCVDSSDRILRSAKDALNQYPRFSLDGRDAMCRSSFTPRTRSTHDSCEELRWKHRRRRRPRGSCVVDEDSAPRTAGEKGERRRLLARSHPQTLAGQVVVWCEPGVVAKLMGLDAMPVPVPIGKGESAGGCRHPRRRRERRELEGQGRTPLTSGSGFTGDAGVEGRVLGLGPRYSATEPHINRSGLPAPPVR